MIGIDRTWVLDWARHIMRTRQPDFENLNAGRVHLQRWYVVPKNDRCNVWLHRFLGDDPRVLHDHPFDNRTWVLSGAYREHLIDGTVEERVEGQTYERFAEVAHRIELPPDVPEAVTLFVTGPRRREWGFLTSHGWRSWRNFVDADGRPVGDPLE